MINFSLTHTHTRAPSLPLSSVSLSSLSSLSLSQAHTHTVSLVSLCKVPGADAPPPFAVVAGAGAIATLRAVLGTLGCAGDTFGTGAPSSSMGGLKAAKAQHVSDWNHSAQSDAKKKSAAFGSIPKCPQISAQPSLECRGSSWT